MSQAQKKEAVVLSHNDAGKDGGGGGAGGRGGGGGGGHGSDNDEEHNNEPYDEEKEAQTYRDYIAQQEAGNKNDSTKLVSPFDKVGLLTKLGGNVKNWLERGFALRSDYKFLHYFRMARDFKLYAADPIKHAQRIAGTIPLLGARIFVATYIEYPNCIEITTAPPDERHYYVHSKKRPEVLSWISKLTEVGVTLVSPTAHAEELRFVSTAPNAPKPVYGMQGWLDKRGSWNTAFQTRFLRIEENKSHEQVLSYYARYDDTKPKGVIPLVNSRLLDLNTSEVREREKDERPECQFAVETANRKYVLRASSVQEKQLWMEVLRMFLANPKSPAPLIDPEAVVFRESALLDRDDQEARTPQEEKHSRRDSEDSDGGPPPLDFSDQGKKSSDLPRPTPQAEPAPSPAAPAVSPAPAAAVSPVASVPAPAPAATPEPEPAGSPDTSPPSSPEPQHSTAPPPSAPARDQQSEHKEPVHAAAAPVAVDADDVLKTHYENTLLKGAVFTKFGRKGKPHKKLVFLDSGRIYWSEPEKKSLSESKSLEVAHITSVTKGKATKVFEANKQFAQNVSDEVCFSVDAGSRTLDLQAESQKQRDEWVAALEAQRKR